MKNTIKKVIACASLLSCVLSTTNAVDIHSKDYVKNTLVFEDIGEYKITGYDTCSQCCGKSDGITASGLKAEVGRTCAWNGVPFGTKIYIVGIGYRVVEDRGGMQGKVIDVLCSNHEDCYAITGRYKVYIVTEVKNDRI